jgi:tetratricopeptide (TPR) repeat protein
MNTIKVIFFIAIAIMFSQGVRGQAVSPEARMNQAKGLLFQGQNRADRSSFAQAKPLLETCRGDGHLAALAEYYLGYADYQLAVVVDQMHEDQAAPDLDSAVAHLECAIAKDDHFAEAYALLSSCFGLKISFSPLKGMYWGPKSRSLMGKARDLAPLNPRVALLDAIGIYNMPSMFGGGKEKGLAGFMHAAELFDRWNGADSLQPDWGKEQVHAWIGNAYLERGESMLAKREFEKALDINPEYGWVKYVLMPKVSGRSGEKN